MRTTIRTFRSALLIVTIRALANIKLTTMETNVVLTFGTLLCLHIKSDF